MTNSYYRQWLEQERAWIGAYCRRTIRGSLWKVIPAVMGVLMLFFGGLGYLNNGGVTMLVIGGVGGLLLGLVVGLVYLALLLVSLRPGRYVGMVARSVDALALSQRQREELGAEMLSALADPDRVLSYQMAGPNSQNTPARVVLTPHYLFQEGSSPYAVLVPFNEIGSIRMGQERKTARTHGTQSRSLYTFSLYTIGFYRRDRPDRGLTPEDLPDVAMGFFQAELRDQVVQMLRRQGLSVRADT